MEATVLEKPSELVLFADKQELAEDQKSSLLANFQSMFDQASEWKIKAEALVITSADQKDEMKMAREGRLALKNIRIAADKKRKDLKAESIRYGNAVQGFYNILEHLIVPIEEHLEEQEKFVARQEAARQAELKTVRTEQLQEFGVNPEFYDLGNMPADTFNQLLDNSRIAFETRQENERKAEADRIAEEARQLQEKDRLAKLERLEAERVAILSPYSQFMPLPAPGYLSNMEAEAFEAMVTKGKEGKAVYEKEQAEIKAENDRLKKEAEEREAAIKAEREREQKEQAKFRERISALSNLGLKFDGQDTYINEDLNVSVIEIQTETDEAFYQIISKIATEIKRRKDVAAEQSRLEAERIDKLWRGRLSELDAVGWDGQAASYPFGSDTIVVTYEQLTTMPDDAFKAIRDTHNAKVLSDKVDAEKQRIENEERLKTEAIEAERVRVAAKEQQEREAELSKGDRTKMEDLRMDLEILKTKYTFKSAKHGKLYSDVAELLTKIQAHITNKM